MGYEKSGLKAWLPVIGLTFSAFIFNTSEFIPIGLLSDIAADFSITESHAGLMITVYAWVVALASLPLMLVFAKTESKKLMLSITALFVVSHVLSGLASDFYMLMLSRMGVACAHAIFWSIVTPLAVKTAPEGKQSTALSFIVSGSSIAMIVGLPLGRTIGLYAGWRATFLIIGAVALIILCILAAVLKKTPGESNFSIRKLPALFKTPALLGIYLITVIAITGHFTGYSYIEPFMKQIVGMDDGMTTFTLILFGLAGIGASVLFSNFFEGRRRLFLTAVAAGMSLMLLTMHPASFNLYTFMAHCMVWGLAFTLFNLVVEFEVIRNAPDSTTVAVAIYSSVFNVGIGCGAVVGGAAQSVWSLSTIGYVGGSVALLALLYACLRLIPRLGN